MKECKPVKEDGDPFTLNQTLIDELKKKGCIQSASIEAAFRAVQRHLFLPGRPLEEVYSDRAIPAKQDQDGQWLSSSSQPAIMAIMLEQLGLQPGHQVLEVGTGTGYNAALMAQLVGKLGRIVTVEIDQDLSQVARDHLAVAGFGQVQVICADGGYGFPDAAPFDRIILTVGAPDITPAYWNQLKPDGRIVLPLMLKGSMKSIAFEWVSDHLESRSVQDCSFILLRGEFASIFSKQIPLGHNPGLTLEPLEPFPIDRDAIYDLLTGKSKDWETGVEASLWDTMMGDLFTWLALHESHLGKLAAKDDLSRHNIVPPLFMIDGKQKWTGSLVLIGETGLAALMRPPSQSITPVTVDQLFCNDPYFSLHVRQFGSDITIVRRLVAQIQAWEAAGRPSSNKMKIRAYPKGMIPGMIKDEFVIEKQWSKFVIEWPTSTSGR